jgi:hypothetical protein
MHTGADEGDDHRQDPYQRTDASHAGSDHGVWSLLQRASRDLRVNHWPGSPQIGIRTEELVRQHGIPTGAE